MGLSWWPKATSPPQQTKGEATLLHFKHHVSFILEDTQPIFGASIEGPKGPPWWQKAKSTLQELERESLDKIAF